LAVQTNSDCLIEPVEVQFILSIIYIVFLGLKYALRKASF
jgi:hypothetical protein